MGNTFIFRSVETTIPDWPEATFGDGDVVRDGKLIYLVSTSGVPTWGRGFSGATIFPGRSASHIKVFDGGIEIERAADYTTTAQLLRDAPEPETVRWYCAGPTYIRLGSAPRGELRVNAFGYNQADSYQRWNSTTLAQEAGITGTFHGRLYPGGLLVDDPQTTYLDVLDDAAKSQNVTFGFNRLDEFEVRSWRPPVGDPVHEFDENNIIACSLAPPEGMPTPVYRVTHRSGETWPSSMLPGAPAKSRDEMTRSPFFHVRSYEDATLLTKHPLAAEVAVDQRSRDMQNAVAFDQWRAAFIEMFGTERQNLTLTTAFDTQTMTIDVGDVVRVTMPRMDMTSGRLFRVVSQAFDLEQMRIMLVVWG